MHAGKCGPRCCLYEITRLQVAKTALAFQVAESETNKIAEPSATASAPCRTTNHHIWHQTHKYSNPPLAPLYGPGPLRLLRCQWSSGGGPSTNLSRQLLLRLASRKVEHSDGSLEPPDGLVRLEHPARLHPCGSRRPEHPPRGKQESVHARHRGEPFERGDTSAHEAPCGVLQGAARGDG